MPASTMLIAGECSIIRPTYELRTSHEDPRDLRDPKTRLQEYVQARKLGLPEYEISQISGKAHKQHFVVTCSIPSLGRTSAGEGGSRRDAEQKAAEAMAVALDADPA